MRRHRDLILALALCGVGVGVGFIVWQNQLERAKDDAAFLRECRKTGYETAKCRVFLTPGE